MALSLSHPMWRLEMVQEVHQDVAWILARRRDWIVGWIVFSVVSEVERRLIEVYEMMGGTGCGWHSGTVGRAAASQH